MPVEVKVLELRDVATCMPILAVRFAVHSIPTPDLFDGLGKEAKLIRHAGWGFDDPITQISRLTDSDEVRVYTSCAMYAVDPGTTIGVALREIHENWEKYSSGDVVECGYLSGRVSEPQGSDL